MGWRYSRAPALFTCSPIHLFTRGPAGAGPLPALPAQHLAEQHPALAVEAGELHLLDRIEVRRTGVELDARQQHGQLQVLDAGGLAHDVLAREIVAALLEDLDQRLSRRVAEYIV